MGRTLLILAVLAGLVLLTRPRAGGDRGGLRGWRWLVFGLGIQVLWVRVFSRQDTLPPVAHWLPCLGLLLALRFVWLNRGYRGLRLLAVGAGLNLLVMVSNGGLMPISAASLHNSGVAQHRAGTPLALTKNQLLGQRTIHLAALDDHLIGSLAGVHVAFSLGDVLVVVGCLVTLGEEVWRSTSRTRAHRPALAS